MEPLSKETKENILATRPEASPEDIAEYERLLSTRFTVDPSVQPLAEPAEAARGDRIRELHHKLFGKYPEEK